MVHDWEAGKRIEGAIEKYAPGYLKKAGQGLEKVAEKVV